LIFKVICQRTRSPDKFLGEGIRTLCVALVYIAERGRRGRDHDGMVVGFTNTCIISTYHHKSCEFESCSWRDILDTTLPDVIKFVSDLRQVSGFLQVLRFSPPIKLTATI
jgi:hypothetical protein